MMFICDQCAREKGQFDFGAAMNLANFVSGFLGNTPYTSNMQSPFEIDEKCEVCGMTFNDIKRTGKIGCSNCYKTHSDKLLPIIKRIHGSTIHRGNYPKRVSREMKASRELEGLKEALARAIRMEEYEKAAEIRDKIKEIESGMEIHD